MCWKRAQLSVAHHAGGQGVASSNPVIPTVKEQVRGLFRSGGAALELCGEPPGEPKYALDEHGRAWRADDTPFAHGCVLASIFRGMAGDGRDGVGAVVRV